MISVGRGESAMSMQHQGSAEPRFARAAVVAAAVLLAAAGARGQALDESTLAAARQLGQDGVALYQQGDYAQASDKLERAYSVVKVPTLGLWSARALAKLGKLVEASQRYREVTLVALKPSDPAVFQQAHADAQAEYAALASRLPQLTIELAGATAAETQVFIDGRLLPGAFVGVPVPVNPGARTLQARRGQDVAAEQLTLAEGERRAVTLTLRAAGAAPAPATAAQPVAPSETMEPDEAEPEGGASSVLPWVVIGAGGAVAVTGAVFIALALDAKSNVEDAPDGTRWSEIESDHDNVPTYSALGIALTSVGAAAVIGGLVWKFTASGHDESAIAVEASATRVRVRGTF